MNDFKEVFQNILGAATVAVDALYPNYEVFGEEVPQNLPERCFIVSLDDVSSRKAFGRRYELKGVVDIGFYSPLMALDRDREYNEVYAACVGGFDVVECGDMTVALPTKTRDEKGGPLHIRCPFTLHIYKSSDDPRMGEISIKEELK